MRDRRLLYVTLAVAGLAILTVGFLGCVKAPPDWPNGGPPRVMVSVPPLYSFVKSVGGDHPVVVCLCTETGPHQYNEHGDHARDKRLVARGDIFFTNGLGLDDAFADPLSDEKKGTKGFVVKLGDHLPKDLIKKMEDGKDNDPHVWLGIPQAKKIVDEIRDELKRIDPDHAADYTTNAAAYVKKLDQLHEYGKKVLADKKDKRIISFHESLGYFADSYGLTIVDVVEDGPGVEPDSAKMTSLVNLIIKEKIHVIAVEPQYPTTTSGQILLHALESKGYTDIQLVEVDPLETAEGNALTADLYEKTVRENLDNLAKHLK